MKSLFVRGKDNKRFRKIQSDKSIAGLLCHAIKHTFKTIQGKKPINRDEVAVNIQQYLLSQR